MRSRLFAKIQQIETLEKSVKLFKVNNKESTIKKERH